MYNKIVKENNPLYFWIVGLFLVIGWLPLLFIEHPATITINIELFKNVLPAWNLSFHLSLLISFISVLTASLLLIQTSKNFNGIFGILLPSFIFVLFTNIYVLFNFNLVIFLVSPFFVFIIYLLYRIFEGDNVYPLIFYIGFINGVLTMFYFPCIIILCISLLGLIFFKSFNIKELIFLCLSFIVPYIFVDVYMYVFQNKHIFSLVNTLSMDNYSQFLQSYFILFIVFVFSLFSLNGNAKRNMLKKIRNRKYYYWLIISQIILWAGMLSILKISILIFILVLFSISLANAIASVKKELYSKLLLVCLLLLNAVSVILAI